VLAQRRPLVHADLQVRLKAQVVQQRAEELEVMTGDDDLQPGHVPGGQCRGGPPRGHRARQVPAQPLRGVAHRVLPGRRAGPFRGVLEHPRIRRGGRGGRGDLVHAGREQRVVGAEQRLVGRRAVEDHRQAEGTELQDLRGQLQVRVQVGVPPAQPNVAGRGEPHGVFPGLAAMPGHAAALEGGAHPLPVARIRRVVMDLVADHVQLGADAAGGEQRRQPGHLQRVPPGRELAGVHQPQRYAGGAGAGGTRGPGQRYVREDRRQQDALAARRRDAAFEKTAQLFGLAQQVPGGLGDDLELIGRRGAEFGHGLRDIGQVCPQPAVERLAPGSRGGYLPAAQHQQIVRLLAVQPGQEIGGSRHLDIPGGAAEQLLPVRTADRDARLGQQRRDQPAGADRRLEQQGDRTAGPGQGLGNGLQPDGGTVQQVQVYVAVDQGTGVHADAPNSPRTGVARR
jgi:hypothetical protein